MTTPGGTEPQGLQVPVGHIVLTTHGAVTAESCDAWAKSQVIAERSGLGALKWLIVPGSLVDKARNEAVLNMLHDKGAGWVFFVDADMLWEPNAPLRILETAYGRLPWADIVGAWCPLRGEPYLPTIDPGSGTWEPIAPGIGPVEVMRTGSAFVLIKRHVFERMQPPWYGVRASGKPLEALLEVDNFANQKFDGKNPLRDAPEWAVLERCATEDAAKGRDPQFPFNTIGEDSGLLDRARALGFRAVVDTDVVVNHIDRKVIGAAEHLEAMRKLRVSEAAVCGVLE